MYPAPTSTVEAVDFVMLYIVGISVVLLLGITIAMVYFVFKYHRKKGHEPKDIHGSILLETIWIAIPTLLVLSMFYFGYEGFKEMREVPDDAFTVEVKAKMWDWDFRYDNGKQTDTLYVPVGKPIKLEMESLDVNHSFYIPSFRIKEDVIVGRENWLSFTPRQTGDFDIACAEYCGLKHSMMYSKVVVMPEEEFAAWYDEKEEDPNEVQKASIGN